MSSGMIIELVGYIGSTLIAVSMLMTSVRKLRIVNTIGSAIFVVYAFIIRSYPTAFMNIFLVFVNIYNLIKLNKEAKNYTLLECYKDESLVQLYLNNAIDDIHNFFPDFTTGGGHMLSFLVMTGANPVGIITGKMLDATTFDIELDYTIPTYRDCSVGTFLYKTLKDRWGLEEFKFRVNANNHDKYLASMGFVKCEDGYVLKG